MSVRGCVCKLRKVGTCCRDLSGSRAEERDRIWSILSLVEVSFPAEVSDACGPPEASRRTRRATAGAPPPSESESVKRIYSLEYIDTWHALRSYLMRWLLFGLVATSLAGDAKPAIGASDEEISKVADYLFRRFDVGTPDDPQSGPDGMWHPGEVAAYAETSKRPEGEELSMTVRSLMLTMDKDRDGYVTKEELIDFLTRISKMRGLRGKKEQHEFQSELAKEVESEPQLRSEPTKDKGKTMFFNPNLDNNEQDSVRQSVEENADKQEAKRKEYEKSAPKPSAKPPRAKAQRAKDSKRRRAKRKGTGQKYDPHTLKDEV